MTMVLNFRPKPVSVTTPIFGGNVLVTTTFTAGAPHLAVFRPKSFAAEEGGGAPAEVVAAERARVATEGWGAGLLALQGDDGGTRCPTGQEGGHAQQGIDGK